MQSSLEARKASEGEDTNAHLYQLLQEAKNG
jgi:hypothetical protein